MAEQLWRKGGTCSKVILILSLPFPSEEHDMPFTDEMDCLMHIHPFICPTMIYYLPGTVSSARDRVVK